MAPLATGILAAFILWIVRSRIHFAPDRADAARLWLPAVMAVSAALFSVYLLKLPGQFHSALSPVAVAGVAALVASGCFWGFRWQINRVLAGLDGTELTVRQILDAPLIATALLAGFAHGANNVGKVAGPVSVLLKGVSQTARADTTALWVIAVGALIIAAGALFFGRRLVRMMGAVVARLNPVRVLCAGLAGAAIVLICSSIGLPVSTTQCAIGGLFGTGVYHEWEDRRRAKTRKPFPPVEAERRRLVRKSYVITTFVGWLTTATAAGLLAAAIYRLVNLAF